MTLKRKQKNLQKIIKIIKFEKRKNYISEKKILKIIKKKN